RNVGDLDRLLELVVQAFVRRSSAARCSLMLVNQDGTEICVKKAVGMPSGTPWAPVPMGSGLAGHVAQRGLPLLVDDVEQLRGGAAQARPDVQSSYRTRSCLLLPLRAPRGVIG